MDWDLPQLRTLAATIDHGSLEAAARALHLTSSAVSQRLRALEQAVGAVLVQRSRPARPTPAGEHVLLIARQIEALTAELGQPADITRAQDGTARLPVVRVAVNADSLASWVLPALAPLADRVCLQLLTADQDDTATLLRDGTVMAAVTSEATSVQGCRVSRLGTMRYHPVASPAVVRRHLDPALGSLAERFSRAPVVVFDDRDALQDTVLTRLGVDPTDPPRHLVPAPQQFAEAVRLGMGWGVLTEQQMASWPPGTVELLDEVAPVDVDLYWQQWTLRTPSLDLVAGALRDAARTALRSASSSSSQ